MNDEEFEDYDREFFEQARAEAVEAGKPQWFVDQVYTATKLLSHNYIEECGEIEPTISDDTLQGLILGNDAVVRFTLDEVGGNAKVAGMLLGLHGPPPIPVQVQLAIYKELQMHRSLARLSDEDTELTL